MGEAAGLRVVYAAAAVGEVAEILIALAADSPGAAERLEARLTLAERQIAAQPSSGRPTFARGTLIRRIVLRPYRCVLFHRSDGEEIVVVGVRHGARDPAPMPGGEAADDLP